MSRERRGKEEEKKEDGIDSRQYCMCQKRGRHNI